MTDDVMSEFVDPNAGQAPAPAEAPATEVPATPKEETPGDDAAAPTDDKAEGGEGQEPEPKPKAKKSPQERIAELTWRAKEAERQRDEALAQRDQPASPPAEAGEPDPGVYEYGETDPQYIRDLARYEARQEFAQLREQDNAAAEQRRVAETWNKAQAAVAAKYDDFDEVVTDPKLSITPVMAQAMQTAGEAGAEVAYYLGSNPAEARRIAALDQISQIRELGKLEARLSEPAKPTPKTISDAPPPPKGQARGAGGQFTVPADTDDYAAFDKAFPIPAR